ncbi:MAG: sugar phosphate isomerase/epimerase family protein [Chloroflexota bacterium]
MSVLERLAFSAWAMREAPVDRQVAIVADAGFRGIELVAGPGFGLEISADATERARIKGLLVDRSLVLTALAAHADPSSADLETRRASLERIKAAVDLAVDLSPPGAPVPVITMGRGSPETYERDRAVLIESFRELGAYARSRGGLVALEPHVGQAMDLPEKVVDLIEAVGSTGFRLNLDNSHFEVMGRDLDDYLPLLIPYSVHTEVKDQRGRAPAHEFLIPGEGDFDYARYLQAMDRLGYRGWITIEISVMVQRRAGYDPAATARTSYATLARSAERAGLA